MKDGGNRDRDRVEFRATPALSAPFTEEKMILKDTRINQESPCRSG